MNEINEEAYWRACPSIEYIFEKTRKEIKRKCGFFQIKFPI
jgi:hypothetical protein